MDEDEWKFYKFIWKFMKFPFLLATFYNLAFLTGLFAFPAIVLSFLSYVGPVAPYISEAVIWGCFRTSLMFLTADCLLAYYFYRCANLNIIVETYDFLFEPTEEAPIPQA